MGAGISLGKLVGAEGRRGRAIVVGAGSVARKPGGPRRQGVTGAGLSG
jgi:hypothetical protein